MNFLLVPLKQPTTAALPQSNTKPWDRVFLSLEQPEALRCHRLTWPRPVTSTTWMLRPWRWQDLRVCLWVWVKNFNHQNRRFWSMCPFTRMPLWLTHSRWVGLQELARNPKMLSWRHTLIGHETLGPTVSAAIGTTGPPSPVSTGLGREDGSRALRPGQCHGGMPCFTPASPLALPGNRSWPWGRLPARSACTDSGSEQHGGVLSASSHRRTACRMALQAACGDTFVGYHSRAPAVVVPRGAFLSIAPPWRNPVVRRQALCGSRRRCLGPAHGRYAAQGKGRTGEASWTAACLVPRDRSIWARCSRLVARHFEPEKNVWWAVCKDSLLNYPDRLGSFCHHIWIGAVEESGPCLHYAARPKAK